MTTPRDRLYQLLPAIYRLRDADEKEPLRALLGVIEAELDIIENDINNLYQNWFIETCDDWIVPYIADLLDVREVYNQTLHDLDQTSYGQREWRALVANTLAYRRRKGTIPVLEQLAKDMTGWRSHAVEFGRLVLTSQNLNHVVTQRTLVNLRADNYVQTIGTPFESQAAYSVDIRSPSNGGHYNISTIGLFVWRLQSYPLDKISPRKITPDRYTFNPLGYDDIPLFNQPQTESNLATLTQAINVPDPLSILPLAKELRQRRQLLWQGKNPEGVRYFDSERDPILEIFINGQADPIAPETILICSLDKEETWEMPNLQSDRLPGDPLIPTPVVAVDPTLGRIKFLDPPFPQQVEVSYSYGFSDDLGGGPYPRQLPDDDPISEVDHLNSVDSNPLAMAIETWNQKAQVWPGIQNKTNIPIIDVTISPRGITQRNHERETFSPGVIRGLSVIRDGRNQQLIVTPGQAIDGLGRIITLSEDVTLTLELLRDPIADYPGKTGFLVIFYQSEQQKISIEFVRETAIDALNRYCIPLAQLTIDSRFQRLQEPETVARDFDFTPGIVWGLEVKMMANKLEAMVTPGLAIDKTGRKMTLTQSLTLNFQPYLDNKENLSLILLQINTLLTSRWQIELVTPDEIDEIKKDNRRDYIELAQFNPIPPLEIEVHKRQNSESVTIEGLEVTLIPSPRAIVEISPGTVKISPDKLSDASGTEVKSEAREIKLENSCRLDLSNYPGQTLTLFISSETEQGLPLTFVGEPSPDIGIVPQIIESDRIYTETILIKDSRTYEGDYEIIIPRKTQLTIIADNGQRPHLHGKIYIRGTAKGEDHQAGELCFEGLLIEGNMIVRSGNLGRLQIRHCTLVPANSQLKVQSRFQLFQEPEENEIDPFNLIGLVISFLTFIYQWICRYLGQKNYQSPYTFSELFQLYCQQLQSLFTLIEQTFLGESITRDDDELELDGCSSMFPPLEHNNIHLEIIIERSICGAIFLADTVPKLTIQNSIIDYKNFRDKSEPETSGICLLAEGVHSDIYNTTLLGTTTVKTIEASNSIFSQTLRVLRKQTGCIRFSYVSATSDTPLRYRCQPDLTFKEQLASDNLPQKITCLAIGKKIGIGTIYNDPQNSNKIIGDGTIFKTELKEGYEIIIVRNNQTDAKEMRIINQIENETNLTINQPLYPPIEEENAARFEIPFIFAGTLGNGLFNSFNQGKQWNNISENLPDFYITAIISYTQEETTTLFFGTIEGKIYQSQLNNNLDWKENILEENNTPISALLTDQQNIWAATAGKGVWKYNKLEEKWQPIPEELDNLNVTSLAMNSQGQLLAGTQGNGVFIYIDEEKNKTWRPLNTGLLDLNITVLIVNSQKQLLAGTRKGGVFYYNDNQNKWVEMNENLTHLNITAMVSSQIKSRISIEENIVTGQNTFLKQEGLKPGAKFLQDGEELGTITQIESDTKLILQTAIQEDIINQEYKNYELIFAATDDGKLFRYLQGGTAWEKLNLDLKGTAITVLNKVDENGGNLFLGTAAGDIMYSQDNGQNWFSMNRGLTNVEQKLTIMASLQPNFTSSFYGDPGYAQLSQNCAIEIRNGGEYGAEMGAFYSLKQPQKEQNLQATLKEYLPFGLQVGTFYIT